MKKIIISAFAILLIAVAYLSNRVESLKDEKSRLSDNQETLLSDVEYYKTSDSLNAAGVNRLTLTNKEFKKYNTDLNNLVESLNIKVKNLQSISTTAVESNYNIKATLRDSIRLIDSLVFDTIKCFEYNSHYLNLRSCTEDGVNFETDVVARDSLYQIVHRIRWKFLFIRWGTKAIRQEVVNANKNSKITYSEYIEFKKKPP